MSLPPLHDAVSSGTFQQPERAALLRGVALRVGPGRSLLLRGAAGAGKSALLRVLCGLWPMGEGLWPVAGAPREIGSPWPPHRRTLGRGDIERRNSEEQSPSAELSLACVPPLWDADARRAGAPSYLVLPQAAPLRPGVSSRQLEQRHSTRPYTHLSPHTHTSQPPYAPLRPLTPSYAPLTPPYAPLQVSSSLLEQLCYPLRLDEHMLPTLTHADLEATAREALVAVGLASLVPRLGGLHTPHSPQAWHASLSPGQRQQLICARVFVHSPALVMLDEATSAMPAADEARIYARLRERGMAFVSIGHRASLEEYHDEVMELS